MERFEMGGLTLDPENIYVHPAETILRALEREARRSPAVQETVESEFQRIVQELASRLRDWPEALEREVSEAEAKLEQAQAALPDAESTLREAEAELARAKAERDERELFRWERARQKARRNLDIVQVEVRIAENELSKARKRLAATERLLRALSAAQQ